MFDIIKRGIHKEELKMAIPAPPPAPTMKTCLSCGQQVGVQYSVCPYCQKPTTGKEEEKSSLPTVAGVMLILSCIGGFLGMALSMALSDMILAGCSGASIQAGCDEARARLMICGVVMLVGAIMAVLGAICSFRRKNWTIALVGALLATIMPGIGPATMMIGLSYGLPTLTFMLGFLLGGGLFGVIGLILVLVAKKHFK